MALVWITATRGVMAIVLGLALALNGDRAPAALVNFMGVYWILNGIVSLQWGLAAEGSRRRLPLAAGAIGIVTGAVVLVANVGTTFLLAILGVVIALTGIAHVLGGFELADMSGRRWRPGVPLGILEIGLGTTLIVTAGRHDSLLDMARNRVGAPRRSRAALRRALDAAPVAGSPGPSCRQYLRRAS
jgi:uncharacterized membrane protein HdeD (DUF308 family)